MFESEVTVHDVRVEADELTDHPVRVGGDPDGDREIMTKLRHVLSCSPGDDDGNDQRGKDHRNTQGPPYHTPGYIFEKPEDDVQVFHFAIAERNYITVISSTGIVVHVQALT